MPGFRVRVLYDYDAQQPDELSIRVNDVVEDVKSIESGWFSGTLRGVFGVFPDNFVEKMKDVNSNQGQGEDVESSAAGKTSVRKGKWLCKALFEYEPEASDELRLAAGDIIEVLNEVEDGWWRGKLNDKVCD